MQLDTVILEEGVSQNRRFGCCQHQDDPSSVLISCLPMVAWGSLQLNPLKVGFE
jgi:hypothetical protein